MLQAFCNKESSCELKVAIGLKIPNILLQFRCHTSCSLNFLRLSIPRLSRRSSLHMVASFPLIPLKLILVMRLPCIVTLGKHPMTLPFTWLMRPRMMKALYAAKPFLRDTCSKTKLLLSLSSNSQFSSSLLMPLARQPPRLSKLLLK